MLADQKPKSVGTTAGTLAAGDDSRIVSAVQTVGSYSDPFWLTALNASKLTGTLSNASLSNEVVRNDFSYSNPSWITALAYSKISGVPDFARRDQANTLVGNLTVVGSGTFNGLRLDGSDTSHTIYNGNRALGVVVDSGNTIFIGRFGLAYGMSVNATSGDVSTTGNITATNNIKATTYLDVGAASGLRINDAGTASEISRYGLARPLIFNSWDYVIIPGVVLYPAIADFSVPIQTTGNITANGYITSVFQSLSANPTTLDLTAGKCRDIKNTTSGVVKRWINDSGILKSITYT